MIHYAKFLQQSRRVTSLKNFRHKHLSHSLAKTRAEKKGTIAPAKFGDEHGLLSYSVAIVDGLQQGINGQTMLWNRLKKIAKRNAEALWNGYCFEVLR
jgi:hypothetical protein